MAVRPVLLIALLALSAEAYAAESGCKVGQIAELPVTMSGMQPMITAKINGQDARFIVDSGTFYSMISMPAAAQYKLETRQTDGNVFIEGVGGAQRAMATFVKEFTFAGVPIKNVPFIVGGSSFSDAAGLIGQNVLGIADVEYDLSNGVVRLLQPKGCGKSSMLAYWVKPDQVYSQMQLNYASKTDPHTTGTALLNDKKIRVLFDTGASHSMLSLKAAEKAGVTPDSPGVVKAGMTRGLGSRGIQTWIGTFGSLKIGDEEIRNIKLRFGDIHAEEDMMLGADFFLSHRIYVATSQHKLYSTFNGGPVFNLGERGSPAPGVPSEPPVVGAGEAPQPQIPEGQPTDAAGYSRRGAAFTARHDYVHAIEDLTKACEMAPTESEYFYQRARAYLENRQPELALADFNQAIRLKPDHVGALVTRAGITLARFQQTGRGAAGDVLADLNKASATAAKEDDVRLELGLIYSRAGAYGQAIPEYDLWLDKHPPEARTAEAYGNRCRSRALLGLELDKALSDCNRAVKDHPDAPFFLDSRGMVYLRMGNFDRAIADYDAVLHTQPRNPWALYGRGLAKLRKGQTADGEADIAAAKASGPRIVVEAQKRGLTP